ncbi:protein DETOXIFICATION 53 [Aristolochia californica]|uniref:protein DETOXIFICATION 53 n=1 Tax=Aristolochia californica TaxID=171875 RepID=UPI0035D92342
MESRTEPQVSLYGEHLVAKEREKKNGVLKIINLMLPCQSFLNEVSKEASNLGKITCPIVITSLMLYSRNITTMFFLGQLGKMELAGGALSIGFANITGFSLIKGLTMGMEPICGQAFAAERLALFGLTFRRTLTLLFLATIPISFLWLHMEPALLWLGQDPTITSTARVYTAFSLPDLLAQALLHPLRIFLRTQGLTTPLTVAATLAFLLHIPINYFLIFYLKLGVKGVALASACNTCNLILALLVYLLFSDTALKPWDGCTSSDLNFHGWRPLLALALPSAASVCLEWWWYEVMLIFCGWLDNPKATIAAMGILIQTTGLIYVFPSSLASGLSTRISHELGAGRPSKAKLAATVGLTTATTCGFMALLFTVTVRNLWGRIFTCERQILGLTSIALPIVGFCELGNCPQTVGCGVLTGSARPRVGANIIFSAFYLIGLPVAAISAFIIKVGFVGLWIGLVAAQFSCVSMVLYIVVRTDWCLQAERAQKLTETGVEGENTDVEANLLFT